MFKVTSFDVSFMLIASQNICLVTFVDLIMGCIKSKENKSPAIKHRTENTTEPVNTSVTHYGAEHTAATPTPTAKGTSINFNSLSMTPFGGSSGVTPFGGASSSFSVVPSSFPAGLTGEIKWTVLLSV